MSKSRLPRDFKAAQLFRLQLSNQQMLYVSNHLPAGYSLILQPKKNIPKHIIQATRKRCNYNNSTAALAHSHNQGHNYQSQDSGSQAINNKNQMNLNANTANSNQNKKNINSSTLDKKNVSLQKNNQKVDKNSNNKWMDGLNEGLKRAAKILTQIKNHKSSWPFHFPVDAQALQIPQYYEIIKQPMDLQTIENKLKTNKYTDFSQFSSDILKIIENSYRFNQANEQYLKITSQFQTYFTKLASDSQNQVETKIASKPSKKKKKTSSSNRQYSDLVPVTLMEKKLLAQQIRRLGKEHIKGVKNIVWDGGNEGGDVFDLQKLGQKKLRELQRFVRNRIIAMEERYRTTQLQKAEMSNLDDCQSDESSFLTDSSQEN